MTHPYDDLTYDAFMLEVDAVLVKLTGLTSGDMPDFPSMDLYLDGVSPAEGAYECLWAADFASEEERHTLLDAVWAS